MEVITHNRGRERHKRDLKKETAHPIQASLFSSPVECLVNVLYVPYQHFAVFNTLAVTFFYSI